MNQWLKLALVGGQILTASLHVVLVHRSKTTSADGSSTFRYNATAAVLMAELLKLIFCAAAIVALRGEGAGTGTSPGRTPPPQTTPRATLLPPWSSSSFRAPAGTINSNSNGANLLEGFRWRDYPKFAIPAAVYQMENNVRFIVLKELQSPVTWVVFSHLEIPIVAAMTFFFLRRKLTPIQWLSIFLLLNGVMASQLAVCESQHNMPCSHFRDYPLHALSLVILAATMAAFAGIATEYLFQKDYETSIFLQNAQLYSFGIAFNLLAILLQDPAALASFSLLAGFDALTVGVVVTMAANGLCVSGVIKQMSNIAKVYASALGLFVTAGLSALVSGFDLSLPFMLAASEVVCALFLYHVEKGKEAGPSSEEHAANPLDSSMMTLREKLAVSPLANDGLVEEESRKLLSTRGGLERRHSELTLSL